jgi:hypothetical protein
MAEHPAIRSWIAAIAQAWFNTKKVLAISPARITPV